MLFISIISFLAIVVTVIIYFRFRAPPATGSQ